MAELRARIARAVGGDPSFGSLHQPIRVPGTLNRAHRATDTGRAPALPAPDDLDEEQSLKTRRLLLPSERLGLTAEIDIVEAADGAVVPVDVKVGRRPHVAAGAYPPATPEVVQWPASPPRAASPATQNVAPRPVMY